jgi:23S rRNA pseudouridine1911/1915/1917 synthase
MPSLSHTVDDNPGEGLRLDRYVAERLRLLSRSQIKARELAATVNGKKARLSRPVQQGDRLELCWNDAGPLTIIPEDLPLDIIYEDDRAVVINKAQGMVVHPGAGNPRGTLANALCYRRLTRRGAADPLGETAAGPRPGIVHRLDKETSGVIVAAYDDEALAFLSDQFRARTASKTYAAIVNGIPPAAAGRIETCIARDRRDRKRFAVADRGKIALTYYKVLKTWRHHSLLLLRPRTGRTHQLRVHLRWLGNPITGDPLYGCADALFPRATLMLHARKLCLTLPDEAAPRTFVSPLPERFTVMLRRLGPPP